MKKLILIAGLMMLSACSSAPITVSREDRVQECVDKYLMKEVKVESAFEMCRQIYKMKTIAETQSAK